jgi:hypothetical protein
MEGELTGHHSEIVAFTKKRENLKIFIILQQAFCIMYPRTIEQNFIQLLYHCCNTKLTFLNNLHVHKRKSNGNSYQKWVSYNL